MRAGLLSGHLTVRHRPIPDVLRTRCPFNVIKMHGTAHGQILRARYASITGSTTVSAGVLNIQNSTALGATSGDTTVNSGAALELQGGIAVGAGESLSLSGTGISSGGALRNVSGDNSWAGAITLADVTGVHRINSDSGTLTIGGHR